MLHWLSALKVVCPQNFWYWQRFLQSVGPTVLLKKSQQDQVAQVQLHFVFLCRRPTASLSNPGLCLTNFIVKKAIPDVQRELCIHYPLYWHLVHWKCSGFISFLLVSHLHVPGRCPWAFSVVWKNQHFLSLSSWRMSRKSGQCLESQWPLNTSTDLL